MVSQKQRSVATATSASRTGAYSEMLDSKFCFSNDLGRLCFECLNLRRKPEEWEEWGGSGEEDITSPFSKVTAVSEM